MSKPFIFYKWIFISFLLVGCNTIKDVKTGEEAFEKKQYHRAISMLSSEYAQTKNAEVKAQKAYLIGKCYDINNEHDAAVSWFESSLGHQNRPETILALAYVYKSTENYPAAIKAFTELRNETQDIERFQKEINICKEVMKWSADQEEYDYKLTSFSANTSFSEYGVAVDRSGMITFVSDRPSRINDKDYNWTGRGFSDIYRADERGTLIELFDLPINSEANEGPVCYSQDFSEIYFTRCVSEDLRDDFCRIYYSYSDQGDWTEPIPLHFFEESINYGNPCLMDSDSILIFSANKSGTDHDLYYSIRQENGWSEALAMPDYLNTNGNEMFPTKDQDTIYFSSDGHPGLGGLDIFKTVLNPDRSFSQAENLRKPINSSSDDFHYTITKRSPDAFEGYLSSSRGMVGSDDIIKFDATLKEKEALPEEETDPVEEENVETAIYLAISIKGQTEDGTVIKLPKALLDLVQNENTIEVDERNGIYILEVDSSDQIRYKATADEFLTKSATVNIANELPEDNNESIYTINKTIILDPIILDKEINLQNIYYDFNKWDIREDAKPSLNELAQILKDNPSIKIQLASHTDCRGDVDLNKELSQKRAESAVQYIISTGILSSRIEAKGYGEENLFVNCLCVSCTEEEHQQNRRTTFKITQ